jgi:acetyl-CoA carboxylase carboxyltransferase component
MAAPLHLAGVGDSGAPARRESTLDQKYVQHIRTKREEARTGVGAAGADKLRAQNKLTARERLEVLLDPGSFEEIALLARSSDRKLRSRTPADGLIAGLGEIAGRPVAVVSEDSTVLAGTRGKVGDAKVARIRALALKHGMPFVALQEAGAGRFQELNGVESINLGQRFRQHLELSGRVPQVGAIMGACFGGPSFTSAQSDFIPMVRDNGFVGVSGPPLVKAGLGRDVSMDDIGGWKKASRTTGMVDYAATDDRDCLESIKRFLSFLPQTSGELPPLAPPVAAEGDTSEGKAKITALIPEDRRKAYDAQSLIGLLADRGSVFSYKRDFGKSVVTALCRIDGMPVGVVANNPIHMAGAMTAAAAIKIRRFVDICDAFHLPLVFLTDTPGFMVGPEVESERMINLVAQLMNCVLGATVPKLTIVLRKAIGVAYMAMGGKVAGPDLLLAWPTAEFEAMGPEAGVELGFAKEIRSAENPAKRRQELLAWLQEQSGAELAAEQGYIDDIVLPEETRDAIRRFLKRSRRSMKPRFKHAVMP